MSLPKRLAKYLFYCLILIAINLHAETKPRLELGIGAGLLSMPDYRGSSERQLLGLPVPYIIYRGDRLRVDRGGITGELLKDTNWELDLSVSASPPANSDENSTRGGMPDLSPAIELGPELKYKLGNPAPGLELKLNLPVRAVISVDPSDFQQIGWLAHPNIDLYARNYYQGWSFGLQAGVLIGDRDYHNYYYGVEERFSTADRPAYRASSGYSGANIRASAKKRFRNFWTGFFISYHNLNGVTFDESPLLEENNSILAGAAFAWIFHQSKEQVNVKE